MNLSAIEQYHYDGSMSTHACVCGQLVKRYTGIRYRVSGSDEILTLKFCRICLDDFPHQDIPTVDCSYSDSE